MEFISGMFFLERLVTCRICGRDETRLDCNNNQIWIVDKDRDGNWTREYICYSCFYLNNRFCFRCGKEYGLLRYYDNDGLWNGRRICRSCLS